MVREQNFFFHSMAQAQTHPLKYTWVFSFMHRQAGSKIQDYTSEIKKLCTVSSVSIANKGARLLESIFESEKTRRARKYQRLPCFQGGNSTHLGGQLDRRKVDCIHN
jgi:hypothetical protein